DAVTLAARMQARLAIGDLEGAEADASAAKTVEEPTTELRAIAKQVQALTRRRDELLAGASGTGRAAVDKFVCAEHLSSSGGSSEQVTTLLNEALAGNAALGPAFGLRAVLHAEHGRLTKALP